MNLDVVLKQIDAAIAIGKQTAKKHPYQSIRYAGIDDDAESGDVLEAVISMVSVLDRLTEKKSVYLRQAEELIKKSTNTNSYVLNPLVGILKALRRDYEAGYLISYSELLHAEIFADFLDMAIHLRKSGYKDPAAVMAGGTLEGHLRKLCEKNGVSVLNSKGEPKKLDAMNADLSKAGVYNGVVQKSVTAWAGVRNSAAHSKFTEYTEENVMDMISGIRNFVNQNPA